MPLTYVIADLHGRYDLLQKALSAIADRATLSATLVTLGDYVYVHAGLDRARGMQFPS